LLPCAKLEKVESEEEKKGALKLPSSAASKHDDPMSLSMQTQRLACTTHKALQALRLPQCACTISRARHWQRCSALRKVQRLRRPARLHARANSANQSADAQLTAGEGGAGERASSGTVADHL